MIDLARTNETLPSLAATVRASLQINPDVLVLFAGNNWNLLETPEVSPYAPSVAARQRYGQALREEGIAGPIGLAAERLRQAAEAAFGDIAELAWAVHIPVVVVIPEVNLADWETRQPPVWLSGDGTGRWHALYAEAVERLDQHDFAGAIEVRPKRCGSSTAATAPRRGASSPEPTLVLAIWRTRGTPVSPKSTPPATPPSPS